MSHTRASRIAAWAAFIAIGGWVLILAHVLWWLVEPIDITVIQEPIEVLNEGNEIAIGEPIVLKLVIDKPDEIVITSSLRFLECDSGNLVTLTSTARDLPPGQYTLVSDNVVLPAKVSPGDVCVFTYRNTYEINPIRTESVEWRSERFTVLAAR